MIVSMGDLADLRDKHAGQQVILAGGVFDLIHPGHIDLFKRMALTADIVVVAVSNDARVKQRKGPSRPIHNQDIRCAMVDAVKHVDYTMIAPVRTKDKVPTVQIMEALHPDIFMTSEESWLNYPYIFKNLNIKLEIIPRLSDEISTTQTIETIVSLHKK